MNGPGPDRALLDRLREWLGEGAALAAEAGTPGRAAGLAARHHVPISPMVAASVSDFLDGLAVALDPDVRARPEPRERPAGSSDLDALRRAGEALIEAAKANSARRAEEEPRRPSDLDAVVKSTANPFKGMDERRREVDELGRQGMLRMLQQGRKRWDDD